MSGIYFQVPEESAPESEWKEWADKECRFMIDVFEAIDDGRMVQKAGLIYVVPTCHDWGVEP